jgi:hypothetical protein
LRQVFNFREYGLKARGSGCRLVSPRHLGLDSSDFLFQGINARREIFRGIGHLF